MKALWLFSPPRGTTDSEIRALGLWSAGLGLLALVVGFGTMAWTVGHDRKIQAAANAAAPDADSAQQLLQTLVMIVVAPAAVGYLFFVAGIYRILLGVKGDNGFVNFLRGCFAFALFMVTFIGSLILYGQINP